MDPANADEISVKDESVNHQVTWFETLDEGKEKTLWRRAPIVLIAGAEWCEACQKLQRELQRPNVQSELQRWVPVQIDVDDQEKTARELNITAIPAFRLLSPDGRVLASREGLMSSAKLSKWLADQYEAVAGTYLADFNSTGTPNSIAVIRIVKEFSKRDATVREAAVTRLLPYPNVAAAHVVSKLSGGSLAEKLTALELLQAWGAPIQGIDPWIPGSFDEQASTDLEAWLKDASFAKNAENVGLTIQQILEAERAIRLLPKVDPAAAAALREQLSRMGDGVLPLLKEAILSESEPKVRQRLLAARYRVAMTGQRFLGWSGGEERLAATDFDERIEAINELASMATSDDEKLLLALFESPEPLVRELAMQTLQRVSLKGKASESLAGLLNDSDANVRAAALKYLAETPSEDMIDRIRDYIQSENDPDLIVFAVRYLADLESVAAVEVLRSLFHHVSWRVRAEAVAAVTSLVRKAKVRDDADVDGIQTDLIGLLEDEDYYIVSKAIHGLDVLPTSKAFEHLIAVAQSKPQLTVQTLKILTQSYQYRIEVAPHLRRFLSNEESEIRATAIAKLVELEQAAAADVAKEALNDAEAQVAQAAIDAVFNSALESIKQRKNRHFNADQASSTSDGEPATDSALLLEIYQKKQLDEWIYDFAEALPGYNSFSEIELILAAQRLRALLGETSSIESLVSSSIDQQHIDYLAALLPVLTWEHRKELFDKLMIVADSVSQKRKVASRFAEGLEPLALQELWHILATNDDSQELVSSLHRLFLDEYLRHGPYQLDQATQEEKQSLITDCENFLKSGTRWQKVNALHLLVAIDPLVAHERAMDLFKGEASAGSLRSDYFRTLLWSSQPDDGLQLAVKQTIEGDLETAEISIAFLVMGKDEVSTLSDGKRLRTYADFESAFTASEEFETDLVSNEQLERLKESSNPFTLAQLAYLLAMNGDSSYLPALVAAWETDRNHRKYRELLYNALAKVDDEKYLNLLEEIYQSMKKQDASVTTVSDFYNKIELMKSAGVAKLVSTVREEYGL